MRDIMSPFDKGTIEGQPRGAFNDAANFITAERIKVLCRPQTYCKPPPIRTVTHITHDWRSPPALNKTQKELREEKPPLSFSQQVKYFIGAVLDIF